MRRVQEYTRKCTPAPAKGEKQGCVRGCPRVMKPWVTSISLCEEIFLFCKFCFVGCELPTRDEARCDKVFQVVGCDIGGAGTACSHRVKLVALFVSRRDSAFKVGKCRDD